jgi:pSer/pThr/pTyr-binding forkhead associated (FHA) protein
VRTAIDQHRDARAMTVVVIGDTARGLIGVQVLSAALSTDELVRQILGEATHGTLTHPPPSRDQADDSAMRPLPAQSPRSSDQPRDSSRPTVTNMPQVIPGAARPKVLYALVSSNGKIFEIESDMPLSIGRADDNQLVLEDPGISRQHALLESTPRGLVLRDLGSAHGVHLNGVPITEHPVQHGDCVQVGRFVFHLVGGDREAAAQWYSLHSATVEQTATVDDTKPLPGSVMRGELSVVDLPAILQMLINQRRSGQLVLRVGGRRFGVLHFLDGRPIHAETTAGLTGVDAFHALLPASRGQFVFQVGIEPPPATIDIGATQLMLEGCRRLAEARSQAG